MMQQNVMLAAPPCSPITLTGSRALVLTYHSANVNGRDYASNDHVALAADLAAIAASGWRFATLDEVLARVVDGSGDNDERLIALTCDDGLTLDAEDFDHPAHGPQRGFLGILKDFVATQPADAPCGRPHLSSFVIVSPDAREQFDSKDFLSLGLWGEHWWRPAQATGLMAIESHSWDHNHPSIDPTAHKTNARGRFDRIDTPDECEAEITQASAYIDQLTGRSPRHFAYPWGQASDYLRHDWLPRRGPQIGLAAAWSCEPRPVAPGDERWFLPRFVCGQDWRSENALKTLLVACGL